MAIRYAMIKHMQQEKILSYLKELVRFQTTQDKPKEIEKCLAYIEKSLRFYPFVITHYTSNGKPSFIATTEKIKHPTVFLVAHIDVVPGKQELFTLQHSGDNLLGRGVCDMKFAIAVFLTALEELYKENGTLPSVGLMFTSEEEIEGNNGPGFLLQKHGYRSEIAIIPDGGDNWQIVEEAKGILQLQITIPGKAGHGSKPWEGESAIAALFDVGKTIQKIFPNPKKPEWVTTCNFGIVQAGEAINQICDKAILRVDIRFTPNTTVEDIIKKIQQNVPIVTIDVIDILPSFSIDKKNKYVQQWVSLLQTYQEKKDIFIQETSATDAPFFSRIGIPCIVSKPVGGLIHSDNEWISLSSIVEYKELLKKFLQNI